MLKINSVYHGDCLEVMKDIDDKSIDMVLCDLPYGTTACPWDSVIPFNILWQHYSRVITNNGAIVLTASQPFTSALVMSNPTMFKYSWVWIKNRPTNFAHAKNKPMKRHEDVLVFSKGTTVHVSQSTNRMNYNPQGLKDADPNKVFIKKKSELTDVFFQGRKSHGEFRREKTGYPNTVIEYATDQLGLHPTQKPLLLFEYLIRTYTIEGDVVLDNCAGSGTTGVACINTNRNYILIEKDDHYYEVCRDRVHRATQEAIMRIVNEG